MEGADNDTKDIDETWLQCLIIVLKYDNAYISMKMYGRKEGRKEARRQGRKEGSKE